MVATKVIDKKKTLAPTLRFKEFDGEWVEMKLGNVLNITSSSRVHKDEWTEKGVPFFRSSDVVANFKGTENTKAYIPLELYDSLSNKTGRVKKDDLLVTGGGSIGIPFLIKNNEPLYFKDADLLWIKNTNEISGYFLYSFFLTQSFKKYIKIISHVGTISHYTVIQAKNTPFQFPTLPEQQKIASFLSAVDEKIQQLTRKKELLEQYKKGVMQQLFSGKLRFKDENGKAFAKWEEKRLGDVGKTFNGLTGKTKENFGDGKLYIQYMQIFSSSIIDVSKCGLVQISNNEHQPRVQYGDVFFTTSSEIPNEIGTCSVLLEEAEEMYLNSFCFGFRPNSVKQLVPGFASYLFRNEIFRKKIIKLAQGSTRYNMSKVQLLKLSVSLPSNEEQKKIANYLSNIDNKIESINKQITQTQTFKKGLLQQMFV